jgi:hypothetical protein
VKKHALNQLDLQRAERKGSAEERVRKERRIFTGHPH